jgi:hypothetical protein
MREPSTLQLDEESNMEMLPLFENSVKPLPDTKPSNQVGGFCYFLLLPVSPFLAHQRRYASADRWHTLWVHAGPFDGITILLFAASSPSIPLWGAGEDVLLSSICRMNYSSLNPLWGAGGTP